jgi:hypothetical protein
MGSWRCADGGLERHPLIRDWPSAERHRPIVRSSPNHLEEAPWPMISPTEGPETGSAST